jgi:hypothetical protein
MLDRKPLFSVKNTKPEVRAKHPDGDKYETLPDGQQAGMTEPNFSFSH